MASGLLWSGKAEEYAFLESFIGFFLKCRTRCETREFDPWLGFRLTCGLTGHPG